VGSKKLGSEEYGLGKEIQVRDDLCNVLRERIVNLHYKPGEALNEKKLADEFQVSRTPVREALIRLAGEKLVTIVAHSGARVSDINLRDLQELIELREILERGVGRLAALNITEEQIRDLEQLSKSVRQVKEEDFSQLADYDMRFHKLIREASRNHYLDEYLSVVQNQFFRIQRLISHKPRLILTDLTQYIQALTRRDADQMEQLMVDHVEHFVDSVRRYFKIAK
jgi:DNA-binding GntR family transcriptional regulator